LPTAPPRLREKVCRKRVLERGNSVRGKVVLLIWLAVPLLLSACAAPADTEPDVIVVPEQQPASTPPSEGQIVVVTPTPFAGTPVAGLTPASIPTPTPLSVESIETLCLEVQQSYPEIDDEFSLPIGETAQGILTRMGVRVATEGTRCEASLTIDLTGTPLDRDYRTGFESSSPIVYCYSGARVQGEMVLAVSGAESLTQPFRTTKLPPFSLKTTCHRKRSQAPFGGVWSQAVLKGLAEWWGQQVYVEALVDEPAIVRISGADALGAMGPDGVEAVPALIHALGEGADDLPENSRHRVRLAARNALRAITGEEFGMDAAAWQEWWEEQ
jgi:hypothetical protein